MKSNSCEYVWTRRTVADPSGARDAGCKLCGRALSDLGLHAFTSNGRERWCWCSGLGFGGGVLNTLAKFGISDLAGRVEGAVTRCSKAEVFVGEVLDCFEHLPGGRRRICREPE